MRKVTCSNCSKSCDRGTTRVFRKLVFHFCAFCWVQERLRCVQFMARVAA
jgi:hypothetical protein